MPWKAYRAVLLNENKDVEKGILALEGSLASAVSLMQNNYRTELLISGDESELFSLRIPKLFDR